MNRKHTPEIEMRLSKPLKAAAVGICRALACAGILLSVPVPALALSSASQQAQLIGEATTLAKACRLPLDKKVAQAVIAQISQQLSPSALYSERKYAEAYTHNDLRRDKVQVCAKALTRFGSSGDRMRNMLRMR